MSDFCGVSLIVLAIGLIVLVINQAKELLRKQDQIDKLFLRNNKLERELHFVTNRLNKIHGEVK